MKISQENIYRVLEGASGKGATVKEILVAMGQKKKRKTQLRKVLKLLSKNQVCYKRNNRYYLLDQAQSPANPSVTRGRHSRLIERNRKPKVEQLGMILGSGRDQTIHSFLGNRRYIISKGNLRDLLQGDIVSFKPVKGKNGVDSAALTGFVERRIKSLKGWVREKRKGEAVFSPAGDGIKGPFRITNADRFKEWPKSPVWLELSKQVMNRALPEGSVCFTGKEDLHKERMLDEILTLNKIPTRFKAKVEKIAESSLKPVRFNPQSGRKDLRDLFFVTIDGEDAKDFDDAVSIKKEGDHYRIWVSIADVDAYVPEGSILDREAFCRGTSTYLPDRVFPMLPRPVSNGICSLKKGVNRKTLTCEMLIDKGGRTLHCRLYSSINKIRCRLTYGAADHYFKTGDLKQVKHYPELPELLQVFRKSASILRKKRVRAGFIDFNMPESRFVFDDKNRIYAVEKTYQSEAMQVIEQLMLLANENVALFCERRKIPIIWRNHARPLPEKREALLKLFWNRRVKISSLHTGKDYNRALKAIKNSREKDFLEYAMLRSMSLAVYETENRGHFGLSSHHYCHFTSPIRRYPDLLVHRALKRHLRGESPHKIPDTVAATASDRERLAATAERASTKVFKLDVMSDRIGELFSAKICGLIRAGIFVEIESPYVEGFVPFAAIYDDRYEIDAEQNMIYGKKSRKRKSIGAKLVVILTGLDWRNLSPEFDWICWQE